MDMFYKFVGSISAVRAIARGSLKFTKIDELNDPSELVPFMNREAVRDSLATVRRLGYSQEQFEWLGCQEAVLRLLCPETQIIPRPATLGFANRTLAQPIFDNLEFMEQQFLRTIALIRQRVGVLSLTKRFDSLAMWAHYGAKAKGYVMCFDRLDREFPGDATGSLNVLKKVTYVDNLLGMTHDPLTQDNIFYSKFKDWEYEREWRVVTALSSCQVSPDGTMYLRAVAPATVTGIICGWNISIDDARALAIELHQINSGLGVRLASLDRGRVVLNDVPI